MYRIREVDGNDDDIADRLAKLRSTFLDAAPFPSLIKATGGLPFTEASLSPSPESFRPPMFQCGLFLSRWRVADALRTRDIACSASGIPGLGRMRFIGARS